MSVQSEFFEALLNELTSRGIDPSVAEENVNKFRDQLKSRAESEEQLDAALSKIPPASIAENIYNMIRSSEGDSDAGAKSEVMVIDTESDTVETKVREGKDAVAPLAEDESPDEEEEEPEAEETENNTETEETEENSEEAPEIEETESLEDLEAEENAPDEASEETDEAAEEEKSEETALSNELSDDDELNDLLKYSPGSKRRVHSVAQTPPGERKTVRRNQEAVDLFMEDTENKVNWLFIVMAIVLVPIAFVLGTVIFAFFIGLWLALAVVITLLLVGLVALVAAGSILSIAGLIFGVIELISGNNAAGMFEIGLALIVGAVVMFVGIWLYNFAVRFIPFIIKKLGVLLVKIFALFKKSFRKIKELTSRI